ncbi:MAG: O-antigen ligase family protein [Flavobacteriaceae bacterium]|nr:O-antigen ligase family protein [Flavobacteriaceae bacterium]
MIKYITNNRLLFIGVHILIGFLSTFSWFPKIFGIAIVVISAIIVFISSNKNEEAFILAAYIVGAEVFIRMTKGFILYETGKYGVILLLVIGIIKGVFKQKFAIQYVFYLLLLALGVVLTQVPYGESIRKAVVFNLSGPVVLGIAAIYFYLRPITKEQLFNALFFMLLPLFSMVTYLYFRTPDLKELVFNTEANFQTSGGFGPNQVATAIGLGIFIIITFMLVKRKISGFLLLDVLFLIYFIFRGLLTFSRGGILSGVIAIFIFSFFYLLYQKGSLKIMFKYLVTGIVITFAIWMYTSNITEGMLDNRYAGKNARGVEKKDITTGRAGIIKDQLNSFIVQPLGIGVGNGKYKRQLDNENQLTAASHNEIGRLLEEHGVIGLIILIGLLTVPLFNFWFSNNYQRGFIIAFYVLWFLTINHSAMRIAFPGFIYALSLIIITDEEA